MEGDERSGGRRGGKRNEGDAAGEEARLASVGRQESWGMPLS